MRNDPAMRGEGTKRKFYQVTIDFVVSRKGGAGKTLLSLLKHDLSLLWFDQSIGVDLNDMNPDFSRIYNSILDLYLALSRSDYISGAISFSESIWDERNIPKYIFRRSIQISMYDFTHGRYTRRFNHICRLVNPQQYRQKATSRFTYSIKQSLLEFSSIMDIMIRSLPISEADKKLYVTVDTNTAFYPLLIFSDAEQTVNDLVGAYPIVNYLNIEALESFHDTLKSFIDGLRSISKHVNLSITYILPLELFVGGPDEAIENIDHEFGLLKQLYQLGGSRIIVHLVANMYVPIIRKLLKRVLSEIKTIQKYADELYRDTKSILDKGLLSLDDQQQIFIRLLGMDLRLDAFSGLKEVELDRCTALSRLLVLYYLLLRSRAFNFSVMPIYDFDLSHIIELLRSPSFGMYLLGTLTSLDALRRFRSDILTYGLFLSLLKKSGLKEISEISEESLSGTTLFFEGFTSSIMRFLRRVGG